MLRAGIFLDVENIVRCGGWGIRFRTVKRLVEAQGAVVVRANVYMVIDRQREAADDEHHKKKAEYRDAIRREGFHIVLKQVQRFRDESDEEYSKVDLAVDLATDALVQSEGLDYVLIGTGDGDFLRLVRALQDRSKKVDLLSFSHTSNRLRREVDFHFSGYLFPGVLPEPKDRAERMRAVMHHVIEDKGFGFLTVQTGLQIDDRRDDVFLHINDFVDASGYSLTNEEFADLKTRQAIIEFELVEQEEGKFKAINASEFQAPEW